VLAVPGARGRSTGEGVGEAALACRSGNRIAPAKFSGRRGPPDITMVVAATTLMVVAATDNQRVGGRTAGMPEWCHAPLLNVGNESS
jgi:hypothetical protein